LVGRRTHGIAKVYGGGCGLGIIDAKAVFGGSEAEAEKTTRTADPTRSRASWQAMGGAVHPLRPGERPDQGQADALAPRFLAFPADQWGLRRLAEGK
jgi:hypothetical protein